MNAYLEFMQHPLLDAIGVALIHFLWQGLLIGLVLAAGLRLFKGASANLRYGLCFAALILMFLLPVSTAIQAYSPKSVVIEVDTYTRSAQVGGESISRSSANKSPVTHKLSESEGLFESINHTLLFWRPNLVALWLLGLIFFSLRLLSGFGVVHRLKKDSQTISDSAICAAFESLMRKMDISHPVGLSTSAHLSQPLLIGWIKPMIILPTSILSGMPPDQIEAILAHELAHIRRHDYLVLLVQSFMETLFFYHPAVWWVSAQMRIEREYCCDEAAVALMENEVTYVYALANLESTRLGIPRLATAASGGSLVDRIHRIVNRNKPEAHKKHVLRFYWTVLVLLILSCSTIIAACEQTTMITDSVDTAMSPPDDLLRMITSKDIGGLIARLHELREAGDPDAFEIAKATYHASADEDLRRNMVYVFAHFNSLASDKFLITIVNTDESTEVRTSALRSFNMRKRQSNIFGVIALNNQKQFGKLFEYPQINASQINAVKQELVEIVLDESQPDEVRMGAVNVLLFKGVNVDLSTIDNIVSTARSTRTALRALYLLKDKVDIAARMAEMYRMTEDTSEKWQITMGIGSLGVIEGATYLLEFLAKEEEPHLDPVYASLNVLYGVYRTNNPAELGVLRAEVESALAQYPREDGRSVRLSNLLASIDSR